MKQIELCSTENPFALPEDTDPGIMVLDDDDLIPADLLPFTQTLFAWVDEADWSKIDAGWEEAFRRSLRRGLA